MNGAMLHNRPMRVDYATGKPSSDERGRGPQPQQQTQLSAPPVGTPLNVSNQLYIAYIYLYMG